MTPWIRHARLPASRVGCNGGAGIRLAIRGGLFIIHRPLAESVSLVGVHLLLEEGTWPVLLEDGIKVLNPLTLANLRRRISRISSQTGPKKF